MVWKTDWWYHWQHRLASQFSIKSYQALWVIHIWPHQAVLKFGHKWWNRELTLNCKFKCYVKPMKHPLGISPSKGNQGTTQGEEKNSFDLDGNQTHNLRIRSTVTLPTELWGQTEKVGDDLGGESWWRESKGYIWMLCRVAPRSKEFFLSLVWFPVPCCGCWSIINSRRIWLHQGCTYSITNDLTRGIWAQGDTLGISG